jgi:hypothetical protein
MPSDSVLRSLSGAREAFRSALGVAVDQVNVLLAAHSTPAGEAAGRAATELGDFAAGRIDPERFAALFSGKDSLDPAALERIREARDTLAELARAGDALFQLQVPAGADLRDAVGAALAAAGRAFGAARTVELARTGRFRPEEHDGMLRSFPARRWNRAERQIAPPLVVEVDGADLRAGGLAEFLEGSQKIVLVARGAAPPAPLVRLITPGVFVLQTTEEAELERLSAVEGPAIAALLPRGAARFVHDPVRGGTLGERLELRDAAPEVVLEPLGALSVFQQREELAQLAALVERPAAAAQAGAGQADPVDKLAAWLLRQADFSDLQ